MMKKYNDTWIIVPAYNEGRKILNVLKDIKSLGFNNILVVDDGSRDKTAEISRNAGFKVLKNIINQGKGAALKTGCDFACMNGAGEIVVIDADGQHEAKDIPKFLSLLRNNKLDIVLGARKLNKKMPGILKLGNNFINKITEVIYKIKVSDTQCGFRAFTRQAYRKIRWNARDYSMESEMIANIGRHNLKYGEVEINTIYADKYKGTTVLDGIKIVFNMIMWRLRR